MVLSYYSAIPYRRYHPSRFRRGLPASEIISIPRANVNQEEHHVALPKLYGQPAYARPPRPVDGTERPLDPDDLPLVAEMSEEELAIAARATSSRPALDTHVSRDRRLEARPFRLRSFAGRLLGGS
jgi:hypothetical protein